MKARPQIPPEKRPEKTVGPPPETKEVLRRCPPRDCPATSSLRDCCFNCHAKLQALVYDIPPWRKVPESDARSVLSVLTLILVSVPPQCYRSST